LTFNPAANAGKRGFLSVALDDIAMTIAGAQHTLGPLGIVVWRRPQFHEENPIANLED
jgi:hypothetical protein